MGLLEADAPVMIRGIQAPHLLLNGQVRLHVEAQAHKPPGLPEESPDPYPSSKVDQQGGGKIVLVGQIQDAPYCPVLFVKVCTLHLQWETISLNSLSFN